MTEIKIKDITEAIQSFGIENNSILLTHSSLRALGHIEDGAEGVIRALWGAVPDGTLVFPTLSSKNWSTVFEDWSLDRPSDVGLISETFRRMPSSLRSDNETHSVAAAGRFAHDIVSSHREGPERWGIFGDRCYSPASPWQKMYESRERYGTRAYVLFFGVSMLYNTYKHFSEYRFVEELLLGVKDEKRRETLRSELVHYPYHGTGPEDIMWPFYSSLDFEKTLLSEGLAKKIRLGDGDLILTDIYESVSRVDRALREDYKNLLYPHVIDWVDRVIAASSI